jgi:uncharacterized protein
MQDGLLRRTIKRVALWNFTAGLLLTRGVRRLRGEKPHQLGGDCRRCASCCEAPAIQVGPLVWYLPTLRRLFLSWQDRVNGFTLRGQDLANRVFIFDCTHFDRHSRRCDSYDSRPGMCRDYPRLLLWQAAPEFLPGCGYRARPPNVTQLLSAVDEAALSDEQKRRLRRDLSLD